MKKIISFLISLVLFISLSHAQSLGALAKQDTVYKPTGYRLGINKLDNKMVAWDKVSWKRLTIAMRDTATLDFASAGATTVSDLTKTISGAALGNVVVLGVPHGSVTATGSYFAWVSAANTVTIRFSPKATENPASGVFDIAVLRY